MNDNMKWSLYAAVPLGIAQAIVMPTISKANLFEFAGGCAGAVVIWFIILYVVLQYLINRPAKTQ